MHLGLRGSSADGAPGDEVGGVLGADGVEELASRRGGPSLAISTRRVRAMRRPLLIWKLLFMSGSLMSPFQPTVVRGFSKYTRR